MVIPAEYLATDPGPRSRMGGESWWGGGTVREGYVEERKTRRQSSGGLHCGAGSRQPAPFPSEEMWMSDSELHLAMLAPDKPPLPLQGPVISLPVCSPLTVERSSD